jgi:HTH-type transcriptional regulator/antitoxin HigA
MTEQEARRVSTAMQSAQHAYQPDYAVPPGETLREAIAAVGMTQADVARRTGLSTKHINQIIQGDASISPDTAYALEHVLGVPARLWNALEANFQAQRIRQRSRVVSEEDATWLHLFPVKELVRRGVLKATVDLASLRDQMYAFFGVAGREAWEAVWMTPDAAFRRSPAFEADPMATAAWLRLGELEAATIEVVDFDRGRFEAALQQVRRLMVLAPDEFDPEMKRLLAESGVALVLVDEIKGSRANGVSRWLSPTKAMIQLSTRNRWEDIFWFSLFHEAGHILLHGKRAVFVEGVGHESPDEDEANAFAARTLIPPDHELELFRIRDLAGALALAAKLEIPPAVVIGRLQKEGLIGYNIGHRYRRRFALVEDQGRSDQG